MIADIIEDIKYRKLVEKQIKETIEYLLENNEEFSLAANLKGVSFEPKIPKAILDNFSSITMFSLSNYTYSTIILFDDEMSFEAGFGKENFSSVVTIPYYAIFQLVVNESILLINPTSTVNKYFLHENNQKDHKQKSRNAFLKNPKNKNLF